MKSVFQSRLPYTCKKLALLASSVVLMTAAFASEASAQSVRVPGFLPSTSGLHFSNAWPSEPDYTINTPLFSIPIGNASQGLCGGMVFTVKDFFQSGTATPLNTTNPADESPFFNYIFGRLIDSFNLQDTVNSSAVRYYGLQSWVTSDGGRAQTIVNEWPGIKWDLDHGVLSPMGLIRVRNDANPGRLGENHQVLAYGYDMAGTDALIHIYDPNYANNDNQWLYVDTATGLNGMDSDGNPLYSFFRVNYAPKTPTPIQASAWSNGFEGAAASAWWTAGSAGVDTNGYYSRTGLGDGWVRNTTGWNAINASIPTIPGATCRVGAWLRSTQVVNGYMSVRSWNGGMPVINEIHMTGTPQDGAYHFYSFDFQPNNQPGNVDSSVLFYVGLWGDGADTWIQVDDVTMTCDLWQ
jgi:hypothetical protein